MSLKKSEITNLDIFWLVHVIRDLACDERISSLDFAVAQEPLHSPSDLFLDMCVNS
jgi:hypothetical protein